MQNLSPRLSQELGFGILGTKGTAAHLEKAGIPCSVVLNIPEASNYFASAQYKVRGNSTCRSWTSASSAPRARQPAWQRRAFPAAWCSKTEGCQAYPSHAKHGLRQEHLQELGFGILGTRGTAAHLEKAGIPCSVVLKIQEGRPNAADMMTNGDIAMMMITSKGDEPDVRDGKNLRRLSLGLKVLPVCLMRSSSFSTSSLCGLHVLLF